MFLLLPKEGKLKCFKLEKGFVSLEFVFMFSFLLIIFVIIFAFEIITIHRIGAIYSAWRIERVQGIIDEEPFSENNPDSQIVENIKFGDLVLKTLKSTNINLTPPSELDKSYTVDYDIYLVKGIFKLYYGKNAPDSLEEKINWIEPGKPPEWEEHQK